MTARFLLTMRGESGRRMSGRTEGRAQGLQNGQDGILVGPVRRPVCAPVRRLDPIHVGQLHQLDPGGRGLST
jgi:hypothetical protein